ncbi:hydrogenase small subunit, partial [Sulfurovum sp.]|uniref:hydrogenase small subunit n=1 Tax=Sulfurovum sp. TaxID=1969726 RepID=UPI003561D4B5
KRGDSMRIVIIGGGIAAVYLANRIKKLSPDIDVLIVSEETYSPYDRIHLCALVDKSATMEEISLPLDATVQIALNEKILSIDKASKRIFSEHSVFSYDKLIIATGSIPQTLFDIGSLINAAVFRNADDCEIISKGIHDREVVIVGSGPIGLELMDTLNKMQSVKHITLLVRSDSLYDKSLSPQARKEMESVYFKDGKITISYEDEILEKEIENDEITLLKTKKLEIANPFLIFGVGIKPNIDFARDTITCDKGILTNNKMQTEDADIYAVGEAAQVEEINFIAGHVKECTLQADVAIASLLGLEEKEFHLEVMIDMLKVDEYELIEVRSPDYTQNFEKILITSDKDHRIDEYFVENDKLTRFIGINSNVDIGYIESLMQESQNIDLSYLYQNRLIGERGRLICSCEHVYQKDLEDIVSTTGISNFLELAEFSQAGRVCGKCKKMVEDSIETAQSLVDPNMPKKSLEDIEREKELNIVKKRIEKFNRLHPKNMLDSENLSSAMDAYEISEKEVNNWIAMVTATMQLHPEFEGVVKEGISILNKVPIIWLELADCSGNSEAFIKSSHPGIEDLIFDYISLDYHELLMSASGDQSENVLENIITNQKGEYVLIVEGAIPMGMDGKFLRIGPKGETGIQLLQKCAKDAALILSVGSCAFDGGVVAAAPNPTGAVGVSEALGRDDIINLPGCPVNPMNIVGTLLSYLMFSELPALDQFNRPLWAYEGRIHDNCERRGHYELGEFVKEWGDAGAQKGWCLFEMGCKGPYANANCPTLKFNQGTSWPVQGGHGCMGCVEKGFFDKLANERTIEEKEE